ncbi:MAG: copper chaperone PCu(A)C [Woeseiaceae bacterium]|nr:copper chaperone PCu(A)C [Woeseiaceae bacterium]
MSRRCLLALAVLLAACNANGPPLVVEDVVVTRPVPGSAMSAAYFRLHNPGREPVVVTGVRSPDFMRVEMHETTVEDGISRMRPLEALRLEPGETVEFRRGGRHLMLAGPAADAGPVTLEFLAGDSLLLSVSVARREGS